MEDMQDIFSSVDKTGGCCGCCGWLGGRVGAEWVARAGQGGWAGEQAGRHLLPSCWRLLAGLPFPHSPFAQTHTYTPTHAYTLPLAPMIRIPTHNHSLAWPAWPALCQRPAGEGVCVQASTLGSLEALLEFLRSDDVQVGVLLR